MKVYRVEHKFTELGPYAGGMGTAGKQILNSSFSNRHPAIWDDLDEETCKKIDNWKKAFGFESLEKLERWFTPWEILALFNENYHIVEVNIDKRNVGIGQAQVVMNRLKIKSKKPFEYNPKKSA